MTFREKVTLEHPEAVNKVVYGGISACPSTYGYESKPICSGSLSSEKCKACWDREIPGTEKKCTDVDIHKIIDDAITNKDRYVSIFIMDGHTSVYVYPYSGDKLGKWIRMDNGHSKCPCCGRETILETPYCCVCGENLAISEEVEG